jgi:Lar family restriction alleviation protein
MSNTLLPCPFCGGRATVKTRYIGYGSIGLGEHDEYRVVCKECRASSDEYRHEAEAIAAWNRRAEPENKPLTLDELRQMDGEPVWIVTTEDPQNNPPAWEIIYEVSAHGVYMRRGDNPDDFGAFELYGKTWLAYRSKPKEEV